jgi:hypothetical protein
MFLANKLNKGAGSPAAPVDAQFNYVTMLLHGDGTNGAQNNTFLDSSTNAFSITRNGNTTQGSFSPYGSNWSNAFDGTSDYIETPSSSAFAFGTGAYTIEGWIFINVMPSSGNIYQVFNFTDDKENLSINSSGTLNYYNGTTGTSSTATVSVGTWTHIAYTRSSTTIKAYINNTEVISASSSGNYTSNRVFVIGARAAATKGANCLNGYLSNVRVLKGTALTTFDLTTNLTAITNTVLLTCQSNRFVDNSSSPLTLTTSGNTSVQRFNPFGASTAYSTSVIGGSGYFDGSGDYLTVADNAALDVDAGSFTMEAWVYFSDVTPVNPILAKNFGSAGGWMMWVQSTTLRLRMYDASASQVTATSSASLTSNSWNHVAATRSSNTLTVYVNGVSSGTATFTGTSTNAAVLEIGGYGAATSVSTGYISDARLVKGSVVYTGNFTPPTAPLTAITDTSLLTNFTNGAIFDNAMMNDLETVGNAQISTSVVKYGTGSIAFDGTGDYLKAPTVLGSGFGTGDFTIEFWLYVNSFSSFQTIVATREGGNVNNLWNIGFDSTGTTYLYSDGFYGRTATSTITSGSWIYVAIVRSSSTIKTYINGTQSGSSSANSQNFIASPIGVGANADASEPMNGYIDDLRITKYARYTTTFTPPTAALPDIGPN